MRYFFFFFVLLLLSRDVRCRPATTSAKHSLASHVASTAGRRKSVYHALKLTYTVSAQLFAMYKKKILFINSITVQCALLLLCSRRVIYVCVFEGRNGPWEKRFRTRFSPSPPHLPGVSAGTDTDGGGAVTVVIVKCARPPACLPWIVSRKPSSP